jgi:chromosome segregation ATPase
VVAVQDDQLSTLTVARGNVALMRNKRVEDRERCDYDIRFVDLELKQIDNRLSILAIKQQDHERSAKALSSAWVACEMPSSIRNELDDKAEKLKRIADEINKLNESRTELTNGREDRVAAYKLAQKRVEEMESELKQIEAKIAEIRGF